MQSVTAQQTTKRPPTNRSLMGTVFWATIVWPACKLAEIQGWWLDRQARHNFGETE